MEPTGGQATCQNFSIRILGPPTHIPLTDLLQILICSMRITKYLYRGFSFEKNLREILWKKNAETICGPWEYSDEKAHKEIIDLCIS